MAGLALLLIALAACAAASRASVATDASTFEFGRFAKHPAHSRARRSEKVCAWLTAEVECGAKKDSYDDDDDEEALDRFFEKYGIMKCGSAMSDTMCEYGAANEHAKALAAVCAKATSKSGCESSGDCEWGTPVGTTRERCNLNDAAAAAALAKVPDAGCRRVMAMGRCSVITSAAGCTASADCKLTSPAPPPGPSPPGPSPPPPPPPVCVSDTTKVISDLTAKCATENICQAYGKVIAHGERCAAKTTRESCDGSKAGTKAPAPAPAGPRTCMADGMGGSSTTPAAGATSGTFCFYSDAECKTADEDTCVTTLKMMTEGCKAAGVSCTFGGCKGGCFSGEGNRDDDDDDDDDDDAYRGRGLSGPTRPPQECKWHSKAERCEVNEQQMNKDHMLSAGLASMSTLGAFKEPCDMAFGHDEYTNKATGETSGRGTDARLAAEAKCTAAGEPGHCTFNTTTDSYYNDDDMDDARWSLECEPNFVAYLGKQGCGGEAKRWARMETLEAKGKVVVAKKANDKASKRLTKAKAALAKCTSQCSMEESLVASAQRGADDAAAAVATAEATVVKAEQTEAESGAGHATSMTAAALAGVAAALLCF